MQWVQQRKEYLQVELKSKDNFKNSLLTTVGNLTSVIFN